MIWAMYAAVAVAGVLLSFYASGVETGSYCLNRVRLRVRTEEKRPAARMLSALLARHEDVVTMALLANALADYLATSAVTAMVIAAHGSAGEAELAATAIVAPTLLVFGGIVPKDLFRREADRLMYVLALPVTLTVAAARLTGFVAFIRAITRALVRLVDPAHAAAQQRVLPRANVMALLNEGAAQGGLSALQRDLIGRVMRLSEVAIGGVMVPRARVASVPIDIARDDFLRIARMAHFSRLPVWRGDPRRVVGMVNVYDALTDQEARPIAQHVRPVQSLHAGTSVSAALLQLQKQKQTMAAVVDRHGHCVGILTLKDLAEEVVGDLEAW